MLGDAVERTELGTEVIRLPKNLWNPDVIRAVAQCDVVFGCMDTVDGRYLLNALSTYYTIPYFDIGVRLDAVRDGAAKGVSARSAARSITCVPAGRASCKGRDIVILATPTSEFSNSFVMTRKEITQLTQLTGKKVGVLTETGQTGVELVMNS